MASCSKSQHRPCQPELWVHNTRQVLDDAGRFLDEVRVNITPVGLLTADVLSGKNLKSLLALKGELID